LVVIDAPDQVLVNRYSRSKSRRPRRPGDGHKMRHQPVRHAARLHALLGCSGVMPTYVIGQPSTCEHFGKGAVGRR
jgi:hypothetical protein